MSINANEGSDMHKLISPATDDTEGDVAASGKLLEYASFREAKEAFEREFLRQALAAYGTIRSTALHIGLSHPAVIKKRAALGLEAPKKAKN
jgi:DNA-binding NtrC family response regulator